MPKLDTEVSRVAGARSSSCPSTLLKKLFTTTDSDLPQGTERGQSELPRQPVPVGMHRAHLERSEQLLLARTWGPRDLRVEAPLHFPGFRWAADLASVSLTVRWEWEDSSLGPQ